MGAAGLQSADGATPHCPSPGRRCGCADPPGDADWRHRDSGTPASGGDLTSRQGPEIDAGSGGGGSASRGRGRGSGEAAEPAGARATVTPLFGRRGMGARRRQDNGAAKAAAEAEMAGRPPRAFATSRPAVSQSRAAWLDRACRTSEAAMRAACCVRLEARPAVRRHGSPHVGQTRPQERHQRLVVIMLAARAPARCVSSLVGRTHRDVPNPARRFPGPFNCAWLASLADCGRRSPPGPMWTMCMCCTTRASRIGRQARDSPTNSDGCRAVPGTATSIADVVMYGNAEGAFGGCSGDETHSFQTEAGAMRDPGQAANIVRKCEALVRVFSWQCCGSEGAGKRLLNRPFWSAPKRAQKTTD